MKKHALFKTIELVIFILLTIFSLIMIFGNADVYHQIASDTTMTLLCAILWAVLLISFLFIYFDFSFFLNYRKEYHEMDYAVHSDPVSGLANRFSCDMIVEKYLDKPLPKDMGCAMIDITNIKEINHLYGHLQGNVAIQDFSNILQISSEDICFVGRNGGNKFLALFENGSEEDISLFLERVADKVKNHNNNVNNVSLEYRYGVAFHEPESNNCEEITQLISLANSRIYK